jgi:hypothetical protein
MQCFEANIPGVGVGLKLPDDTGQRNSHPGNHHGPGLYAAKAVNTFFEFVWGDQVVVVITAGFITLPIDGNPPGMGFEVSGISVRIFL